MNKWKVLFHNAKRNQTVMQRKGMGEKGGAGDGWNERERGDIDNQVPYTGNGH